MHAAALNKSKSKSLIARIVCENGEKSVTLHGRIIFIKFKIMNKLKSILILLALVFACQITYAEKKEKVSATLVSDSISTPKDQAKQARKAEKQKAKDAKTVAKAQAKAPTDKDVVYLFGVGFSFNDTVLYMTDIIPLKRIALQKRTKFLPYRSEFSLQWREHLEGKMDLDNQTTSVFYATKRKKIAKRYYKMKRRCLEDLHKKLVIVGKDQFSFTLPEFNHAEN